jgi:hypothetical protein
MKDKQQGVILFIALFLVALGVGNWTVGSMKAREYLQVSRALEDLEPHADIPAVSTVFRVARAASRQSRTLERYNQAKRRLEFYSFVARGGVMLCEAGLVCALIGMLSLVRRRNASIKSTPET